MSSSPSSKACRVTFLLFLENKLKGLSYVALPRLFAGAYYFRPGSGGVGAGYPEWEEEWAAEKHFGYQTLADLTCSLTVLLNFPIIFLLFFSSFHIYGGTG